MKEEKQNNILSKNFMVIVACLLTVLGICYGFVYFNFFGNVENNEEKIKNCTGTLSYLIDYENNISSSLEISKKDASEFYNEFDFYKLKEIEKKDIYYEYSLEVCDLKVYYSDIENVVLYKDKYYTLGKNKDMVEEFIEPFLDDFSKIYFYELSPEVVEFALSEKDYNTLRHLVENINFSVDIQDLMIKGKYLIAVDDYRIYLDDFNGYGLYNGNIVELDKDDLLSIGKYFEPIKNEGCCSCCPDLKPGESCIALCCPCNNEK